MLQLVTTSCNIATLVVLITGAIAAVVQLAHLRAGNQLQAVLAIERGFAEAELQSALLFVQGELGPTLAQPAYRAELVARGYVDPRKHPEMTACNWFNDIGTMISGGFVDEEIIFDSFGRLIERYWDLLAPTIALLRRERGAQQYANFEFLAYRAQRWNRIESARSATSTARMPIDDPWLSADVNLTRAHGA